MRIGELWDRHKGQDVWVVGTGPSMRVFPRQILEGRVTIGCNQAWRDQPVTYSLTVHPELYLEYERAGKPSPTQWIIKKKQPMEALDLDDPEHYVFLTSEGMEPARERIPDTLHLAKGIHCTAISLAAHMGARCVYVVGCDACTLRDEHHAHAQHVRYHGLKPADVFAEYRKSAAKVRRVVRESLGVPVVTVSPFVGLADAEEDYLRLCKEHKLPKLPKPKDTSPYSRKPEKKRRK